MRKVSICCLYSSLFALRWPTCGELLHLLTCTLLARARAAGSTSPSRYLYGM